jgi:hypothetical protein
MFIIMKKLLLLFGLLVLCCASKAQISRFPVKSNIGGSTTENRVPGLLSADRAFRVPRIETNASVATFEGALTYSPTLDKLYLYNGTTWQIIEDKALTVSLPLLVASDVLSVDTLSSTGLATQFDVGGGITNFYFDAANRRLGIQNQSPQSILDVSSTTSAFLPPRMTKAQRDAINPKVAGMVIFQTDNTPGLRVWNGINWMKFAESTD